jgi:hypothetical protein
MSNSLSVWQILRSGRLYLWVAWAALFVVWMDTVVTQRAYLSLAIVIVCLLILYFAEGMEIAAAELLDKDPKQLASPSATKVLNGIKQDKEWFFAQRQVFVVAIISLMTLLTSYKTITVPFVGQEYIDLPFVGRTELSDVAALFSFLLTSLTVLWWCQVFPKRLAIRNSERFLHQSAFIWRPLKLIGMFNMPGPADGLVWLAKNYTGYRLPRKLKPSPGAYYNEAVLLYGFSEDRHAIDIKLNETGGGVITKKYLLIFVHGDRHSTQGAAWVGSSFIGNPDIEIKGVYTCHVPERIDKLSAQLDSIFDGKEPGGGDYEFSRNLADELRMGLRVSEPERTIRPGGGEEIKWNIDFRKKLPHDLSTVRSALDQDPTSDMLVALMYEVRLQIAPGGYETDTVDYQSNKFHVPCRRFSLKLRAEVGALLNFVINKCEVTLIGANTPFSVEEDRVEEYVRRTDSIEVPHPLQGSRYVVRWDTSNLRAPNISSKSPE